GRVLAAAAENATGSGQVRADHDSEHNAEQQHGAQQQRGVHRAAPPGTRSARLYGARDARAATGATAGGQAVTGPLVVATRGVVAVISGGEGFVMMCIAGTPSGAGVPELPGADVCASAPGAPAVSRRTIWFIT